MNCKYCGVFINWVNRKPINTDNTPHTFEYCQSVKKSSKEEAYSKIADDMFKTAIAFIEDNNRKLKDPNYLLKSVLRAPVASIEREKVKVSNSGAIFQGILCNGAKCSVSVTYSGIFQVSPRGKSDKNIALFQEATQLWKK